MLHRDATIVHKPEGYPWCTTTPRRKNCRQIRKKNKIKYKANKVAGTVRPQGVYDTDKQQTRKQHNEAHRKNLADRGGNLLSGEPGSLKKRAQLSFTKCYTGLIGLFYSP
jgi:hypothetical protein